MMGLEENNKDWRINCSRIALASPWPQLNDCSHTTMSESSPANALTHKSYGMQGLLPTATFLTSRSTPAAIKTGYMEAFTKEVNDFTKGESWPAVTEDPVNVMMNLFERKGLDGNCAFMSERLNLSFRMSHEICSIQHVFRNLDIFEPSILQKCLRCHHWSFFAIPATFALN